MSKVAAVDLIPVTLGDGLVVLHRPDEYERLMQGVDREAAVRCVAPLEYIEQKEEESE